MKKGFTLIELTAVIILIALISVLAVTTITRSINSKKNDISAAMQKIIESSVDMYMSYNPDNYPKVDGNTYCIQLKDLIDLEIMTSPIKDPVTNDTISENKYVKTEFNVDKYIYNLVDTCTEKR